MENTNTHRPLSPIAAVDPSSHCNLFGAKMYVNYGYGVKKYADGPYYQKLRMTVIFEDRDINPSQGITPFKVLANFLATEGLDFE